MTINDLTNRADAESAGKQALQKLSQADVAFNDMVLATVGTTAQQVVQAVNEITGLELVERDLLSKVVKQMPSKVPEYHTDFSFGHLINVICSKARGPFVSKPQPEKECSAPVNKKLLINSMRPETPVDSELEAAYGTIVSLAEAVDRERASVVGNLVDAYHLMMRGLLLEKGWVHSWQADSTGKSIAQALTDETFNFNRFREIILGNRVITPKTAPQLPADAQQQGIVA